MRKRFARGACVAALTAIVAMLPSCGDGIAVPKTLSGEWHWTVEGTSCQVIDGILNGPETFDFNQTGSTVTAGFTDSFGNVVTISGTYDKGTFLGTMEVRDPFGRVIVAELDLWAALMSDGERMLDGDVLFVFDSDGFACNGALTTAWLMTGAEDSTAEEVFTQCGAVDIVFMMDTSGSMDDEALALCNQIDQVFDDIAALGLEDVRIFKWGITEDASLDPDFPCLTHNVDNIFFEPIVPGTTEQHIKNSEDWGNATAVVSELGASGQFPDFQWRSDAIRIIVPISDEGPDQGDPPDTQDDADSIARAIQFANANDVIVSPIIGSGAEPPSSQHALDLAAGTDGIAFRSTDPDLDFGQLIFDIVFTACGGTLEDPDPPSDPGPTILVAAGRSGNIYSLDPSTGADTFLVPTPLVDIGVAELTNVSSMIYNEETGTLWAGTGGQAACPACLYTIRPSGTAEFLFDNIDEADAHPGMAQRRSDRFVFGMEPDDDVMSINNKTGFAVEYGCDIGSIDEEGQALTLVGENLYLASGDDLWMLDTFTGAPTFVAQFTLIGFPTSVIEGGYNILSMTTRPSDNKVFALLRDNGQEGRPTRLCTINVSNGTVTNIGQTANRLDGLTWAPAGYFQVP